ncbi:hypothetical protein CASFOL_002288 [Castilleja foliolosa]|uniref:Uncharacterized protein n=1 Tax=Castilleja foliolosa TaxID=1961234 RepID=A0ABD3EE32_9LAMI
MRLKVNNNGQSNLPAATKFCKTKKIEANKLGVDDVLSNALTRET